MDWTRGYSSHWKVYEVDTSTWADGIAVEGINAVSIERDCSSSIPLLESGSIFLDDTGDEQNFTERYLRIVLYAEQDGGLERVDVATLLCSSSTGTIDKGYDGREITGSSVLYPASRCCITNGTYAPIGVDGAEWAAKMLRECIAAPVEVEGSFTLDVDVVFELGMTYLECVWNILDAGGFVMQIAGDGRVYICEKPYESVLTLDDYGARLLHPAIKYSIDWRDVPNRYFAIENGETAMAINDDEDSLASTVTRGYFNDYIDRSPVRINGESLQQYAERSLEEMSYIPETRTYSREYQPGIYPFDIVRGTMASVDLDGTLRIIRQSLTCGRGIKVSELAQGEVSLWTR